MIAVEDTALPFKLPPGWQPTSVGDEFFLILGKMLDAEKNVGVLKHYLGNKSVQWGRIDTNNLSLIKLTPTDLRRYCLADGDLLVCEGGDIGRSAIWRGQLEECYFQKALHRVRPRGGYSPVMLRYLLELYSKTSFLLHFATQTSIAHLPKDKFELLPLPKPPLPEQHAIAGALSDADGVIEGLERLIAKKRRIKQGAMQDLLTARRRLPGFSGEWEAKPLSSVSAFITKGATPTTYGFGWETHGILFLRSECVSPRGLDLSQSMFISEEAHRATKRSEVTGGDLLITITGNVGRVVRLPDGFGDANINQHIARIRISADGIDPSFVFHQLSRPEYIKHFNSIVTGQAYPQISLQQVRDANVDFPEIAEQTAIARILTEMDTEIQTLETRLKKARQIKEGMMQNLLTGRIRLV